MRKQILSILLILVIGMGLISCGDKDKEQSSADKTIADESNSAATKKLDSTTTTGTLEKLSLTLYADFSNGFSNGNIKEKMIKVSLENEPASQSLIALALADGLSEWTGLNFTLNDVSFPDDESIIVDWSKNSTLIKGLGDLEPNQGFHFYDAVSLNWFMMDSLATTLKNNMEITKIYYQSEAQPVTFPNPEDMATQGLPELPIDQTYEGSAFFLSRAGDIGQGD
jgi:hypothetical protein